MNQQHIRCCKESARRSILVSIMLAFCGAAAAQAADPLPRANEETIFSFRLKDSGKHVSILASIDEQKLYFVYRFGTADAVELEFPADKENSPSKFAYSGYMRGGGPENEGLDLHHLSFVNNGWQYIVYDEYAAVPDSHDTGVLVVRLKDCKVTKLIGRPETITGSLNLLNWSDDAFAKDFHSPCQEQINGYLTY